MKDEKRIEEEKMIKEEKIIDGWKVISYYPDISDEERKERYREALIKLHN